jgi:hypothetical protein
VSSDEPASLPMAYRQEFVHAFVEQAWTRPGHDRPVTRVHIALMVTMAVVVVVVVTGVILQMLAPVKLSPAAVSGPMHTSSAPHYTAVAGWDCGTSPDRGFEATGRTPDWYTVARGGWSQDGCHGTFEAVPLSGDPVKPTDNTSSVWWFAPTPVMARCDVAVYLPSVTQPGDAAATAAQYFVTAGHGGSVFASFVLDQTSRRGGWQPAGTYAVGQPGIGVELLNQGVAADGHARLAITQVRVTCTG